FYRETWDGFETKNLICFNMKKINVFWFVVITVLTGACSNSSSTSFSENGISFTCPAGWIVDEKAEIEEGFYVCAEKEGTNDSGMFMVMAFNDRIDPDIYINTYEAELNGQGVFDNLSFSSILPASYGMYEGSGATYTASVMGVDFQGKITMFEVDGRSVCITTQEALEDRRKNNTGFKTIEESFRVE
ncbi:MAG: hypothetical protein LUG98_14675, partial [Tannerellaceae bacterium]|nr:hypothetical protein [Tannerellaceae bacterium]